MANWYYYDKTGNKIGPVSATTLKALARQGRIVPGTMIENEQGKSSKAGQVKGLEFPSSSAPIAVPRQPPSVQPVVPPVIGYSLQPTEPPRPKANVGRSGTGRSSNAFNDNNPISSPLSAVRHSAPIESEGELLGMKPNTFFMLMHLSQFLFAPVSTIVLWVLAKDKDSRAGIHGKSIANAIISYTICNVLAFIDMLSGMAVSGFEAPGYPLFGGLIALAAGLICLVINILWFVSIILVALKANKGEIIAYPWVIGFFHVETSSASPPLRR